MRTTAPRALLGFFGGSQSEQKGSSTAQAAVERLLSSIADSDRGLGGRKVQQAAVLEAAAALAKLGAGSTTTEPSQLSATWR